MEDLVTPDELARHLNDPQWMIFDCRFSLADELAGWRDYVRGHIPNARYADMNSQLSATHRPGITGRHPLPKREDWTARVQGWGIRPSIKVVAYDDAGGAVAARLWWMLRWIGHGKASVLNGGWQAWVRHGGPVAHRIPGEPTPSSHDYAAEAPLARLAAAGDIDSGGQVLLDARDASRFRGEEEPVDPVAGHIPGALCAPFKENLDREGRFRPPEELRSRFQALLDGAGKPVVSYCGSGVTAAHNILAMKLAGFEEPMLYAGSWSEWITDPARPIATGD